jgi:hypothetical protein
MTLGLCLLLDESRGSGQPISYRDDKGIAIEAAKFLKERLPQEQVGVRDMEDGSVIEIGWESGRAFVVVR